MFVLYHLPKDIENIVWYYVHHDIFLPSLNAIKSLEFRENNPTIYSKHHSRCVNLYCIIDTDNYRLRKKDLFETKISVTAVSILNMVNNFFADCAVG